MFVPACNWFKKPEEASAVQAKETAQEPKFRILDADSVDIYNDAHIPGAVNVSADTH